MGAAEPLRLVFMGTPDLAAAVLETVLDWPGGEVVGVYCQPDKPAGRGLALKAPPVKVLAESRGIPVFQPKNFKNIDDVEQLRSLRPDYLLVAAYGLILPQAVLDIPTRMPLNVHTSLLPKYRGAAPIQRAIMDGEAETGVSIMVMEAGLDTGPVVSQEVMPIAPDDTAGSLHDKLALAGGAALLRTLEGLEEGTLIPRPQLHDNATYAAKLSKQDGRLDFTQPAAVVDARARGVSPWPGAFGLLERENGDPLSVGFANGILLPESVCDGCEPGDVASRLVDGVLAIRCKEGFYGIPQLRPAGKKWMDAASFFNGYLKGRGKARFLPENA